MRRITLVSQVFHPDEQATSQLMSGLIEVLSQLGWDCTVLCGFPGHDTNLPAREEWNKIKIRRGGLRVDGKKSLSTRALGYAGYCAWVIWRLLFRPPRGSTMMVVTNPPFLPILVWLCSAVRGFPYDILLHDLYPDGLVAVGGMKDSSMVTCLWRTLNGLAFRRADHVLVLGRDMAELCQRRYALEPDKVIYFPNWSPFEAKLPVAPEQTRLFAKLDLAGKFVVQYSGNMGLWHDLDTIVEAAALLRDTPAVHLLLIGDGRRRERAQRLAESLALTNLSWLGFQPKGELDDSLRCCHAALISQREGLEGVAVPSKLYGILASGRAALAQVPVGSETALVVQEEECGLVIPPRDAQGLADAIKRLAQNRYEADAMGKNAFAAYREKYTLTAAVARFEQAMTSPSVP